MKSTQWFACIAILLLPFSSCKEDPEVYDKAQLTGYIQMGPFLKGSSVLISELNKDLSPMGQSFTSQVKGNDGSFEFTNLQFSSPYVELKSTGIYYNVVTNEVSSSPLTLYALADLSSASTLNANILSTLEMKRVKYLVEGGLSFNEGKKKAMQEILSIFDMEKSDLPSSEMLNINVSGDDNAILLAISAILQGFRTEAELSELLDKFSADIATDGQLDSEELKTSLISQAKVINRTQTRNNLDERFMAINTTRQIPEFEKYMVQFIEKSTYQSVELITYPEIIDNYCLNLLNEKYVDFPCGSGYKPQPTRPPYSFLSVNTMKGMNLWIKLEYLEGKNLTPYWRVFEQAGNNWVVSPYDNSTHSQIFTLLESGKPANLRLLFASGDGLKVRISSYIDNYLVPTRSRIVSFQDVWWNPNW